MDRNFQRAVDFLRDLCVATREGGVDRNPERLPPCGAGWPSPPARVAWIETAEYAVTDLVVILVATREGGVDRN